MQDYELGVVQTRFAELVWNNAPIASGDLVKLCERELQWKKSTTYTVLRKLCEKGLFVNENGTVSVLIERDAFYAAKSAQIVNAEFGGSLPAFIAAFTSGKPLLDSEVAQIQSMIDAYRKEKTP